MRTAKVLYSTARFKPRIVALVPKLQGLSLVGKNELYMSSENVKFMYYNYINGAYMAYIYYIKKYMPHSSWNSCTCASTVL